jgi:hypothetical protein
MELTDAEREEFNRLTADTFDPDIWDENDLPLLRAIKREEEKEQAQESGVLPVEKANMTGHDEDREPEARPHDEV